ncbi:phosphotransferase family protein [Candidatus Uabimicrobium sp. HlEnr_7]|uniref:phosphotransferase family protein n=1 Tax=Candidatus Uabimicrobium helgolandensis TaxID=3095367 RepID=UPI0035580E9F
MCAMKNGWQRLKPLQQLNEQQINEIMRAAFPTKKVRKFILLSGGLANTNYCCLFDDNSKILLRIYTRDKNACLLEKKIHQLLKNNLPIPEILHLDNSQKIIPHPFVIMQWHEGISLRQAIDQKLKGLPPIFFKLGTYLQVLQKHSFSQIGTLDEKLNVKPFFSGKNNPFLTYIYQCLQTDSIQGAIENSLLKKIHVYLNKNEYLYPKIYRNIHLSHGDYNPANILICPKSLDITAILDWEFSFAGSLYCDIGNMLRDEHVFPQQCVYQFVAGVQNGKQKLDQNWQKMCKLIDLTNLIAFLSSPSCVTRKTDALALITQTVK